MKDVTDETRLERARALLSQRRPEEALRELLPPLTVSEAPRTRVLRARCLHQLNRRVEAIASCRAQLALEPEDAEANGFLALLLYEREQLETVRRHIDGALRRDPAQADALLALALLQLDGEQEALARASLDRLLRAHPGCGRAWLARGLIELGRLRFDAARCDILVALRYTPEHVDTWHVLAWIEIMLGNLADAERAFQRALAADRNCGETHGGLAITAALRADENTARIGIQRALRLDHDSISARYAEVVLLNDAGRRSEARDALEQILLRPVRHGELAHRVLRKLMRILAERASRGPP